MPDELPGKKGHQPERTIQIQETIRNAPMEEGVDEIVERKKGPGRPSKTQAVTQHAIIDDDTEDQFAEFLRDGTCKIHVDRVSPREWKGKPISGMIEEYPAPITKDEIEADLRNRYGGGRYRIRVIKNGRFVAATGVNIGGDPKIEVEEDDDDDFEMPFEGPPVPPGFRSLPPGPPMQNDEITQLRLNIEKEKLSQSLDEIKENRISRRSNTVDAEKVAKETEERIRREMALKDEIRAVKEEATSKMDAMVSRLEQMLRAQKETDPGRQHDIVALDNKIERIKTEISGEVKSNFAEIRALLTSKQESKPDTTPQMMQAIIAGFAQMSQGSDAKIQALMQAEQAKSAAQLEALKAINEANARVAQAQTDKLVTVMQSNKSNGGIEGVAATIAAVRDIAETMGMSPGGVQAEEAAEPASMSERFVGMFEKALPTVLAALKQRSEAAQQGGRQLTQQEVQMIIQQEAKKQAQQIAPQIAQQMQQRANVAPPALPAQQPRQPLPAPQPIQQVVPPQPVARPSGVPMGPQPINVDAQMPPPQPPVAVSPEAAQAPPAVAIGPSIPAEPVQQQAPADPVHEHKSAIVNDCMEELLNEIKIRPRSPGWIEQAFEELPEDILDTLVIAVDVEGVLAAINGYAKPEYIVEMTEILKAEPRAVDWFVKSLNSLKDLYNEESEEAPA